MRDHVEAETLETGTLAGFFADGGRRMASDPNAFAAVLKATSVFDLITTADGLDLPDGSSLKIDLYRHWLVTVGIGANFAYAVWYNLGVQCNAAREFDAAKECYENALRLKADFYQPALNLGTLLELQGQDQHALATWTKALQPDEARIAIFNNRGRVLENQRRYEEAAADFRASLLIKPDQPGVLHHLIGLRTKMCAWPAFPVDIPGVSRRDLQDATRALTLLALCDDVALQLQGNRSWVAEKYPPAPTRLSPKAGYRHAKIRVGYLSSDFCEHPVAYLVRELFEAHDRDRFEVYAFCSTRSHFGEARDRVAAAVDHFVEVLDMSDEEAARRICSHEIDILVDLNGLTLGTRLPILRWRPAPVQMTYLGYNGPVPLPELDYLIADPYVIPPDRAADYEPKPLYVSQCYQSNDSTLPIAAHGSRADAGLPENVFVFCCFCNTYKITEEMFDAWLDILSRADTAILWLFVDNEVAKANLLRRTHERGMDAGRLVFAARTDPATYRGRLALADLFLDTFPYNAGTTASDALRVGLPLLTLRGDSFIARMASSILDRMDLREGIATSREAYISQAVRLAGDRVLYQAYRAKVTPDRWRETIGDTVRFCRDLEQAYMRVVGDQRPVGVA